MKKYIIVFLTGLGLAAAGSVFALSIPTCSISVSPTSFQLGVTTPVTITWHTSGADYNGVISPELGHLAQSGSEVVSVPGKSTSFEVLALSGTTLVNSMGNYAYCRVAVSTYSHSSL